MSALPSAEEMAAIAAVLRVRERDEPHANERAASLWRQTACREGVRADVPRTWRG